MIQIKGLRSEHEVFIGQLLENHKLQDFINKEIQSSNMEDVIPPLDDSFPCYVNFEDGGIEVEFEDN